MSIDIAALDKAMQQQINVDDVKKGMTLFHVLVYYNNAPEKTVRHSVRDRNNIMPDRVEFEDYEVLSDPYTKDSHVFSGVRSLCVHTHKGELVLKHTLPSDADEWMDTKQQKEIFFHNKYHGFFATQEDCNTCVKSLGWVV